MPGVGSHQLGPCDVDGCGEQSARVARTGQDLSRVWPLPLAQPWLEDRAEDSPTGLLLSWICRQRGHDD